MDKDLITKLLKKIRYSNQLYSDIKKILKDSKEESLEPLLSLDNETLKDMLETENDILLFVKIYLILKANEIPEDLKSLLKDENNSHYGRYYTALFYENFKKLERDDYFGFAKEIAACKYSTDSQNYYNAALSNSILRRNDALEFFVRGDKYNDGKMLNSLIKSKSSILDREDALEIYRMMINQPNMHSIKVLEEAMKKDNFCQRKDIIEFIRLINQVVVTDYTYFTFGKVAISDLILEREDGVAFLKVLSSAKELTRKDGPWNHANEERYYALVQMMKMEQFMKKDYALEIAITILNTKYPPQWENGACAARNPNILRQKDAKDIITAIATSEHMTTLAYEAANSLSLNDQYDTLPVVRKIVSQTDTKVAESIFHERMSLGILPNPTTIEEPTEELSIASLMNLSTIDELISGLENCEEQAVKPTTVVKVKTPKNN